MTYPEIKRYGLFLQGKTCEQLVGFIVIAPTFEYYSWSKLKLQKLVNTQFVTMCTGFDCTPEFIITKYNQEALFKFGAFRNFTLHRMTYYHMEQLLWLPVKSRIRLQLSKEQDIIGEYADNLHLPSGSGRLLTLFPDSVIVSGRYVDVTSLSPCPILSEEVGW